MGKLEKKKEAKLIHPNSRKAAAMVKKKIKTARREMKKERGNQSLRLLAERLVWFRDNLDTDRLKYSLEETHQLIERYIARNAAELEQLRARAVPRGPTARRSKPPQRLTALEATQRTETDQFTQAGIEVADLTSEDAVLYLRAWDGQVKLVPQIKTRRFIRGRLTDTAPDTASEDGQQMAAEADGGPSDEEDEGMTDEG